MSVVGFLRSAVSEMEPIDGIKALLDAASILADHAAMDEQHASDPFTSLAQLIDTALARAEQMQGE